MKNNRKNRKRITMYFKKMNNRFCLSDSLQIKPNYLYGKNNKSFSVFSYHWPTNNPNSEIIK